MEDKKVQARIQLGKNHALTSDGSRNLILLERYEKKLTRGKNSEGSGVYDYREVSYHGAGLDSLISRFKDELFIQEFGKLEDTDSIVKALEDMKVYMNEVKTQILDYVQEHVTLEYKNVKGADVEID